MKLLPKSLVLALSVLLFGAGCAEAPKHLYSGPVYPPTTSVAQVFQANQVPEGCTVFAHLLLTAPAPVSGRDIADRLTKEAESKGADLILIGRSRKAADDVTAAIDYYGPTREYLCHDKWCGWKFGFDTWSKQGDWVSFGYSDWGNDNTVFHEPLMLQAAFLRCR